MRQRCTFNLARVVAPLLVAAALGTLLASGGAAAQGLDETCLLALTKLDEGTTNVLYPDDSARYYSGLFTAVPGTEILLTGRFPHTRYMSFNVYDQALRPVDALADVQLAPDPGSINPFVQGASRTATNRSYTAVISFAQPPATRARNTMYAEAGQPGGLAANPVGDFVYRIYVPDNGQDEYGGVGLPTAEVVQAGSTQSVTPSVCAQVHKPETTEINTILNSSDSMPAAETTQTAGSVRNPPHWRKFVNVASSVGMAFTDNPSFNNAGQSDLDTLGGSGGFLSNRDNAYVSALTNRGYGQVLVTQLRAPTFPNTRPGTPVMPGGQLRYWSVCQNDPVTERVTACLNDDRSVVAPDGIATFVVSTPNERPTNATAACGVNWLPWGPDERGALIYRNMLPAASFAQAIQKATPDHESATMGDYFPVSRYYADAHAFQALGCAHASAPAAAAPPARAPARACVSRRRFVIHVPAAALSVRIAGRRVSLRGPTAVVDLRGLPREAVRAVISLRGGRRQVRTYHPCRPGTGAGRRAR